MNELELDRRQWKLTWTAQRLRAEYRRTNSEYFHDALPDLGVLPVSKDPGVADDGCLEQWGITSLLGALDGPEERSAVLDKQRLLLINLDVLHEDADVTSAIVLQMVSWDETWRGHHTRDFYETCERLLTGGVDLRMSAEDMGGFTYLEFVPPDYPLSRRSLEKVCREGREPPASDKQIEEAFEQEAAAGSAWYGARYGAGPIARITDCEGDPLPGKDREIRAAFRGYLRGRRRHDTRRVYDAVLAGQDLRTIWDHRIVAVADLLSLLSGAPRAEECPVSPPAFAPPLSSPELWESETGRIRLMHMTPWQAFSSLENGALAEVALSLRGVLSAHGVMIRYSALSEIARTVLEARRFRPMIDAGRVAPVPAYVRPGTPLFAARVWQLLDLALCEHVAPLLPEPATGEVWLADLYSELLRVTADSFGGQLRSTTKPTTPGLPRLSLALLKRYVGLREALVRRRSKGEQYPEGRRWWTMSWDSRPPRLCGCGAAHP